MNPLIKKEIRLLLPGFLIGVALIGVALIGARFFLSSDQTEFNAPADFVSGFSCASVAVFMALNSFGAEISSGTFSMLLAQPVSREHLWRAKTRVLAVTLLLVGLLWSVNSFSHFEQFRQLQQLSSFWDSFFSDWTFLLVVFSGALWTVLLFRQMAAAFWFTVLTPGVILVAITGLWPEKYYAACEPVVMAALLIYSVAGFWFAHRLFLRAQDVQWTGGNIVWPEIRRAGRSKAGTAGRRSWRPGAALFWKEVQLHQSGFVLAGALLLLHLGVLAARTFGHFHKNSSTEFILEIFWGLWLIMPMLVGAAAVAEERKLGTLAGQICLPVKWSRQFAVKFRMVVLLSLLFGALMPLLLEGERILPGGHILGSGFQIDAVQFSQMSEWKSFVWSCFQTVNSLFPVLVFAGMAAAIGVISFYASSLTRNTLQALAPAVLGIIIFAFLFGTAGRLEFFTHSTPWRGSLIYFISIPASTIMLVALSSWNSRRVNLAAAVRGRNVFVAVMTLALVLVATTAIYHRAWERLTPFEGPHGAARLSLSNISAMNELGGTVSIRFADGRIWTDGYFFDLTRANPLAPWLGNFRLLSTDSFFYEGSNWVKTVSGRDFEIAGIKTDGTLWVSKNTPRRERWANGPGTLAKTGALERFGGETNWSSIGESWLGVLLVKTDGTLWLWGPAHWDAKQAWPGLNSFTPRRLGTESDWVEVFNMNYQPLIRKADGSIWAAWVRQEIHQSTTELEPGFSIQRAPQWEAGTWRSTTSCDSRGNYALGIKADGTFRIRTDEEYNQESHYFHDVAVDLQFGKETNWLAVAGQHENIVTLKNDGTLWRWYFPHDTGLGWNSELNRYKMLEQSPSRLGTHADWIAITSAPGGVISLAADGSLWYWPLAHATSLVSEFGNPIFWDDSAHNYFEPLLDVSHKPQFLGNVLNAAN